jgi:uncharacterized protein with HEPN domain
MRERPSPTIDIDYNSFFDIYTDYELTLSNIDEIIEQFINEIREQYPNIKFNIDRDNIIIKFNRTNVDLTYKATVDNLNYINELQEYVIEIDKELSEVNLILSNLTKKYVEENFNKTTNHWNCCCKSAVSSKATKI